MNHLLLSHRNSKVNHANHLERTEKNERKGRSNRVSQQREEEGDHDVKQPKKNVSHGSSLINEISREILRCHNEEERTGARLESENEEEHTDNGNDGNSLNDETGDERNGIGVM